MLFARLRNLFCSFQKPTALHLGIDSIIVLAHKFLIIIIIIINVFIVYLFVISVATMDASAQTLTTAKKSKSVLVLKVEEFWY